MRADEIFLSSIRAQLESEEMGDFGKRLDVEC